MDTAIVCREATAFGAEQADDIAIVAVSFLLSTTDRSFSRNLLYSPSRFRASCCAEY